MTRHLTVGALALSGLTFIAACGGSPSGSAAQVASLADDTETTTTTAAASGSGSEADTQQAMLDFAKCMREHGVDMPDPVFNEDGSGGGMISQSGGPGDESKMNAAQEACQSFLDKVRANMPPMDPAQMEEEKQKMLGFAQCMRDHGIDFPDPTFDSEGGGFSVRVGGAGVDPESPGFKEAQDECAEAAGMPKMGEAGGGPSVGTQGGKS